MAQNISPELISLNLIAVEAKLEWEYMMKKANKRLIAHLTALAAIIFWGGTFVSTKVLLDYINPFEIIICRFLIAYTALWIAFPRFVKPTSIKEEMKFFFAGICGMTLYFMFENFALDNTTASNVALLITLSPVFTAIIAHIVTKDERFSKNIAIGFLIAITGIFLVIFNGDFGVSVNIVGDILALAAAAAASVYLIILKKIGREYNYIHLTRKVFFYGIITMIPVGILLRPEFEMQVLMEAKVVLNLLFLGIIASALCFFMWNTATGELGTIKVSTYIYLIPVVGMVASRVFLGEEISVYMITGAILILFGTYTSEHGFRFPKDSIKRRARLEKTKSISHEDIHMSTKRKEEIDG